MKFAALPLLFATVFIAAIAVPSHAETLADIARARQFSAEAMAARKAGDFAIYLERMQAAIAARPNMPGLMLRVAGAQAMNGQNDKALAQLEKIAAMGLAFNIAGDADFIALKDDPRFRAVIDTMAVSRRPLVKSTPAFELPEKDFLAEGIAHDAKTGNFYVAGVYQRKIVKRLPGGEIRPFAAGAPADALWSMLALAVDARRRLLWATTAAIDLTRGIDEKDIGRTAVLKFDLDREKLLARYELADRGTKRSFGDLALADNGEVYISDSIEGGIYRIADDKFETFIAPGTFTSPQGMAWIAGRDGGKWLYTADYSLGLLRIDTRSRAVEWVPPPANGCLLGLDGLVRAATKGGGDMLIATQNGIRPHRVVRIDLDAHGQVTKVTPLEANHPRHNEPTLGVMVGGDFYYNANSQWELFERGKPAPLDQLAAPVILRLPITTP